MSVFVSRELPARRKAFLTPSVGDSRRLPSGIVKITSEGGAGVMIRVPLQYRRLLDLWVAILTGHTVIAAGAWG